MISLEIMGGPSKDNTFILPIIMILKIERESESSFMVFIYVQIYITIYYFIIFDVVY